MKKIYLLLILSASYSAFAQESKRVLFIGNSYTGVNNLPQLTHDLSLSAGDTLIFDSNTPGGQTFEGHFSNTTTLSKIQQGNWDFVVLQEQSQRPSFPDSQVEVEVFPFAHKLDSTIRVHNSCAETIFYMTWGRKNGDAGNCQFWPPVCTYAGMDSILYANYVKMAEDNEAILAPVGKLWNYLRTNYPNLELYNADESHPSLAGSYAAACSFYVSIFRKDPTWITSDYGLNASEAQIIRNAAKLVVFDEMQDWFIGTYDPLANLTFQVTGTQVQFTSTSQNAENFSWNFGDGASSQEENPIHTYSNPGVFAVQLIVNDGCGLADTTNTVIDLQTNFIEIKQEELIRFYPNPVTDLLHFESKAPFRLEIWNIQGAKLATYELKGTSDIDFSTFNQGTYLLIVRDEMNSTSYFPLMKD